MTCLFLLAFFACTQHVTADKWQHMSPSEKTVYVRSMLGGEKAKDAKGGTGHHYSLPADDYVKQIDAAYARGDRRDPAVIFAGLANDR